MSSFLRPASSASVSRGLGQFEVLGPLINLATSGVGLYLEKEQQRRAALEAKRALALAQYQAATEAAAVQYALNEQAQQQAAAAAAPAGVVSEVAGALSSPYVLAGAVILGALLLRR